MFSGRVPGKEFLNFVLVESLLRSYPRELGESTVLYLDLMVTYFGPEQVVKLQKMPSTPATMWGLSSGKCLWG